MTRVAGLIAVLLMLAGVARAEPVVAPLEALTMAQWDKVGAIFMQQQRNFGESCKSVKILKAETLTVAEPLIMGADKAPIAGRWHVRYSVDVCGLAGLRMADFRIMPNGIAIDAMMPGDTLTNPALQADVLKSFRMAGQVAMPACTEMPVIRDTQVHVYPKASTDRWQELWIGNMCGRDLGQAVEFLPNKNGTTFKMSLPVKPAVKPAAKAAQ